MANSIIPFESLDISKLYSGLEVKNFPTLCSLLNLPISAGESKIALLADLERYCSFSKKGFKFIIHEIYEFPKPKLARKDNIWVDNVGLCILHRLSQCTEVDATNVSFAFVEKYKLVLYAGLCGEYFYTSRNRLKQPSKVDECFYDDAGRKFTKVLDTVLSRLRARHAVTCNIGYEFSTIDRDNIIASEDEATRIRECYEQALIQLGYDTEYRIVKAGLYREYKRIANSLLRDKGFNSVKKGFVFGFTGRIYNTIAYIAKSVDIAQNKLANNSSMKSYMLNRGDIKSNAIETSAFRDGKVIAVTDLRKEFLEEYRDLVSSCIELDGDGIMDTEIEEELEEVESGIIKVLNEIGKSNI